MYVFIEAIWRNKVAPFHRQIFRLIKFGALLCQGYLARLCLLMRGRVGNTLIFTALANPLDEYRSCVHEDNSIERGHGSNWPR